MNEYHHTLASNHRYLTAKAGAKTGGAYTGWRPTQPSSLWLWALRFWLITAAIGSFCVFLWTI